MKKTLDSKRWSEEDLDLMTLIEPLACVQHAYGRLPETLKVPTARVFGGGPIGSLHVIEIRRRFPGVRVEVIDPSPVRRALLSRVFPGLTVGADASGLAAVSLSVVATSDPAANLDAIRTTRAMGHVVHFSGLNHKTRGDLVSHEGIDIEALHRHEETRRLKNGTRLVGSSGYSEMDIERSILSLKERPEAYRVVQTAVVSDLDSRILVNTPSGNAAFHQEPVIETLLNDGDAYMHHLKVVFRVRAGSEGLQVSPARSASGELSGRVKPSPSPADLAPGYVRVQMLRFSICNTDRRVLQGTKSATVTEDLILGHEGVGMVIAIGPEADVVNRGLSLILPHYYETDDVLRASGIPYLSTDLKHLGVHISGCFTQVVDVPSSCIFAVDPVITAAARSRTAIVI